MLRISRAVITQIGSAIPLEGLPKLQSPANVKSFEIINNDENLAVYLIGKGSIESPSFMRDAYSEKRSLSIEEKNENEKRNVKKERIR